MTQFKVAPTDANSTRNVARQVLVPSSHSTHVPNNENVFVFISTVCFFIV